MSFNITNEVNYGALGIGESNDPLDRTTLITPTGNVGLNHELSGPTYMCTDFPTCSGNTIDIGNQKYALKSSTTYSDATTLTTTATLANTNILKPTAASPPGRSIWWGILVPEGTSNGSYDGTITVTGIKNLNFELWNNYWYDRDWSYRTKITIDSTTVDSNLTDYPLYIDLSQLPSGFHTNVNQTDARDIRVTEADGETELPREVVYYDSTTDTGELYFKADISSSEDTDFYIYHENLYASDYAVDATYGRNNVWTNGYVAVYHFQESSGTIVDSTGNNDATTSGTTFTSSGKYGGARYFNGSSDYIYVSSPTNIPISNSKYTIDAWINLDDAASAGIVGWGNYGTANEVNAFRTSSTSNQLVNYWWSNDLLALTGAITLNSWHHVVADFDSTTRSIYYDGGFVDSDTPTGHDVPNSNNFRIGLTYTGEYLEGEIDELRISNIEYNDEEVLPSDITYGILPEEP
jgi:hypothetical protein